jgi:hypothetical protein
LRARFVVDIDPQEGEITDVLTHAALVLQLREATFASSAGIDPKSTGGAFPQRHHRFR